jgi:hypothetical protein
MHIFNVFGKAEQCKDLFIFFDDLQNDLQIDLHNDLHNFKILI